MILKKILSRNFIWFSSFHISTQTKATQIRVSEPAHTTVKFYFVTRFQTFRYYFEVNTGRVQISSMRDISVSTCARGTETALS